MGHVTSPAEKFMSVINRKEVGKLFIMLIFHLKFSLRLPCVSALFVLSLLHRLQNKEIRKCGSNGAMKGGGGAGRGLERGGAIDLMSGIDSDTEKQKTNGKENDTRITIVK